MNQLERINIKWNVLKNDISNHKKQQYHILLCIEIINKTNENINSNNNRWN